MDQPAPPTPDQTPAPGSRSRLLGRPGSLSEHASGARELADAARDWLLSSPIVGQDGGVYSWLNPSRPGYVYPEIMGYYVGFAAAVLRSPGDEDTASRARDRGARVAAALAALADDESQPAGACAGAATSGASGASGSSGAIGRGEIAYVFDTCIALNGLVDFARASGDDAHRETLGRMATFVDRSLAERAFAWRDGRPAPDPESWSLTFGASALKTCLALHRAAEHLDRPELAERAALVVRAVCDETWREGAFRINPASEWVYAHAHSYALEGLLYLRAIDRAPAGIDVDELLRAGTAWSAARQNADGSLTGWHQRPGAAREHQGDATSQSVRLWCAVDPRTYEPSIARALGFLRGLQTESGGLLYNAGSQDVNSWVSMFAWQAAEWVARDAASDASLQAGVL